MYPMDLYGRAKFPCKLDNIYDRFGVALLHRCMMKFVASNQPHRAFENVYAIFTKPFENQVETIKYKI